MLHKEGARPPLLLFLMCACLSVCMAYKCIVYTCVFGGRGSAWCVCTMMSVLVYMCLYVWCVCVWTYVHVCVYVCMYDIRVFVEWVPQRACEGKENNIRESVLSSHRSGGLNSGPQTYTTGVFYSMNYFSGPLTYIWAKPETTSLHNWGNWLTLTWSGFVNWRF